MSWTPKQEQLQVKQGDTLVQPFGVDLDLTGWGLAGQVRSSASSLPAALAATFEITVTDAAAGEFEVRLDPAVTAALTPHRYLYDVEMADVDDTYTLVEGELVVTAQVTQ